MIVKFIVGLAVGMAIGLIIRRFMKKGSLSTRGVKK